MIVKARWSDLQLGAEHLFWLGEAFTRIKEADHHRFGPFANKIRIAVEIGPVVVYLCTASKHPPQRAHLERIRCDFFVAASIQSAEDEYTRFAILAPVAEAEEFGKSLLAGLSLLGEWGPLLEREDIEKN